MAKRRGLTGETTTKAKADGEPKRGNLQEMACRHCGGRFWGGKDAKTCGRSPCYERENWDNRQWLGLAFIAVRNGEAGRRQTELEQEALRRVAMSPEQIVEAWRGTWPVTRTENTWPASASSPSQSSSTPLASGF